MGRSPSVVPSSAKTSSSTLRTSTAGGRSKDVRRRRLIALAGTTAFLLLMAVVAWRFDRPLADAVTAAVAGDKLVTFRYDGSDRSYRIHEPAGRPEGQHRPLVLALHGGGQDATAMAKLTGLDNIADREGFTVAYPMGRHRRWNDGLTPATADDVGFLATVIDRVAASTPIDRNRLFLTGVSDGAVMAN